MNAPIRMVLQEIDYNNFSSSTAINSPVFHTQSNIAIWPFQSSFHPPHGDLHFPFRSLLILHCRDLGGCVEFVFLVVCVHISSDANRNYTTKLNN